MKKDTYITEVIFRKRNRKDFKGDIIALFPYDVWKSMSILDSIAAQIITIVLI